MRQFQELNEDRKNNLKMIDVLGHGLQCLYDSGADCYLLRGDVFREIVVLEKDDIVENR